MQYSQHNFNFNVYALTATLLLCGGALWVGVLFIFSATAYAAPGINEQIHYQGVLKNSSGTFVSDGNYDIVFRFYDAASGGTTLWTGTHTAANGNAVTVTDGVFSVLLGSGAGNSLASVNFNQDTIYLGITIGTDSEMLPRQRVAAAAYAFNANTLDGIGLATSSLSTGDILYFDGTDLARLAVGSNGQVLKLAGGIPSWGTDANGGGLFASSSSAVIHPADTNDVLVLGGTATTTAGYIFEVVGSSLFDDVQLMNATSSGSVHIGGSLGVGSEYFTDLTGSGLANNAGVLTVATSTLIVATSTYALTSSTSSVALSLSGFNQNDYLTLSAWNATTTDTLTEGSTNRYYATALFASDLAGTTTDALNEGSANFYWTNVRFDERLAATTTLPNLAVLEGVTNLVVTNATMTSATSTNLFASVARFTTSIIDALTLSDLVATNATSTSLAISGTTALTDTTNSGTLTVTGLSTFSNASTTNLSVSGNLYTGLTANSIPFVGAGGLIDEDTSNLVWDDINNRLGIGSSTPYATLVVAGDGRFTSGLTAGGLITGTSFTSDTLRLGVTAAGEIDTATGNLILDSAGGTVSIDDALSVAATTTLASVLNLSSNRILNVANPAESTDAANKDYVDSFAQGLVWQEPVLTIGSTTPPGSPSNGDRHIVAGSSASGAWAGEENKIAEWNGSSWTFASSTTGFSAFVSGAGQQYTYNNTEWVELGSGSSHANLSGLQGGNGSDQYYHLSLATYQALTDVNAQLTALHTDGTPSFAGLIATNATTTSATSTNLYVSGTLSLGNALSVANGGTGTTTATTGGLFFYDGSTFTQDTSNLFWDDTNNRLGVGIGSPNHALHVGGNIQMSSSSLGVILDGQDLPLITRGFDVFSGGDYSGIGRWGLFMEPGTLTLGVPNKAGARFQFVRYNEDSTIASTPLRIDENGNVGIGSTTPTHTLTVEGTLGLASTSTPSVTHYALYNQDGTLHWNGNALQALLSGTEGYALTFDSSGTAVATSSLFFAQSGNIGIGTTSPNAILHVDNGSNTFINIEGDNFSTLNLGDAASENVGGVVYSHASNTLSFRTNGGDRLFVDALGYVGIGSSTPSSPLTVNGSIGIASTTPAATNYALYNQGGSLYWNGVAVGSALTGSEGQTLVFNAAGNPVATSTLTVATTSFVGIGHSDPNYPLEVRSAAAADSTNVDVAMFRANNIGDEGVSVLFGHNNSLHTRLRSDDMGSFGGGLHIDVNNAPGSNNGESWVTAATFLSDGDVGIGDSTPDGKIEIRQTGTDDIFNLYDNTTNVLTVLDGGNVGIGTSTPGAILHIDNGSNTFINIEGDNFSTLNLGDAADPDIGGVVYTHETDTLSLKANDIARVFIDASGNLGIGTSTPEGALHVHVGSAGAVDASGNADDFVLENSETGGISILTPNASESNLFFGSASDELGSFLKWSDSNDLMTLGTDHTGADILFATGLQSEGMRLTDGGRLGIGSTTPGNTLVVNGGIGIASTTPATTNHALYNQGGALHWNGTQISSLTSTQGYTLTFDGSGNQVATSTLFIGADGRIGINPTGNAVTPEGILDINGALSTGTSTQQVNWNSDGTLTYGTEYPTLVLDARHATSNATSLGFAGPLVDFRAYNATDNWSVAQIVGVADPNGGIDFAGGLVFSTSPGGFTAPTGRRTQGEAPIARMLIDHQGRVGIGTTSPAAKLAVQATSTDDILNLFETGGTEVLTVLENGNVGIGTASPDRLLHVYGGGNQRILVESSGSESTELNLKNASSTWAVYNAAFNQGLRFHNGNDRMAIEAGGDVGIGTTNPDAPLHVHRSGSGDVFAAFSNSTVDAEEFEDGVRVGLDANENGVLIAGLETNSLLLGTNDTTRMTITKGGLTGLGDTAPDNLLDVASSTGEAAIAITSPNADPLLKFELTDNSPLFTLGIDNSDSDTFKIGTSDLATDTRFVIDSSGNVGIGTTNPDARLHVDNGTNTFINIEGDTFSTINLGDAVSDTIGGIIYNHGTDVLSLKASTTERLFVSATGIGIGESSPGSLFAISGGATIGSGFDQSAAPTDGLLVEGTISIGTTSPASQAHLHINASDYALIQLGDNTSEGFHITKEDGDNSFNIWSGTIGSATNRFSIESNGNIGIGTNAPSAILDIESGSPFIEINATTTNADAGIRLQENGQDRVHLYHNNNAINPTAIFTFDGTPANQVELFSDGQIMLNTGTSTEDVIVRSRHLTLNPFASGQPNAAIDFQASGISHWFIFNDTTNGDELKIHRGSGQSVGSGAQLKLLPGNGNVWQTDSDIRLKEHIEEYSVLDKINDYRAVSFNWKSDGNYDVGVIAQELYEVFPESVGVGDPTDQELTNGMSQNAWSVGYASLAPLGLQGVKELSEITIGIGEDALMITTTTFPEGLAPALASLADTSASTTNVEGNKTFAGRFFDRLIAWFADTKNGIGDFVVGTLRATDRLCVGETCVTENELKALLANEDIEPAKNTGSGSPSATAEPSQDTQTGEETTKEENEQDVGTPSNDTDTEEEPVAEEDEEDVSDTIENSDETSTEQEVEETDSQDNSQGEDRSGEGVENSESTHDEDSIDDPNDPSDTESESNEEDAPEEDESDTDSGEEEAASADERSSSE